MQLDLIAGRGQNNHNIFIIIASNHPSRFDKAFKQRFERKIFLGLPRHKQKYGKLKVIANSYGVEDEFSEEDLRKVETNRFSQREIVTLTRKAIDVGCWVRSHKSNHFHEIEGSEGCKAVTKETASLTEWINLCPRFPRKSNIRI